MRTTVTFDDDTAAAIDQLRRERNLGISDAVNELIRKGLLAEVGKKRRFVQRTSAGHARLDLTNVVEAIEQAEAPAGAP